MSDNIKKATAIALALVILSLLLASFSAAIGQATDQALINILPSSGGTTNPVPGNYTYNSGDVFNMTAVPDSGFQFSYWVISGSYTPGHTNAGNGYITDPVTGEIIQLPTPTSTSAIDSLVVSKSQLNITCGFGYTYNYQAVFASMGGPSPVPGTTDAVVIVMPTTGGTVTPAPGSYTYANGTIINISATANSGFAFKYWLVSGSTLPGHTATQISTIVDENGTVIATIPYQSSSGIDSTTFTANPAHITCGYGYTYTYTAIFEQALVSPTPTPTTASSATIAPTSTPTVAPSASSSPTPAAADNTMWIIVVAVVVVIVVIAIVAFMMLRRK